MGVFLMNLVFASLLAIQCRLGQAIPFTGQARAVATTTVGDYTYQGCYAEPSSGRALESVSSNTQMTLEMCASICAASTKSKYFGVEYGKECWCGNTLSTQATLASAESECSFKCPGNTTEHCGASSRLSLFMNANVVVPSAPTAKQSVGDYTYKGCYTDAGAKRALSKVFSDSAMTVEKCVTYCSGSKYIGLEYSGECWCGSSLDASSGLATAESECNMACKGDSSTLCGGSSRLNLYQLTTSSSATSTSSSSVSTASGSTSTSRVGDYLAQGCWTDNSSQGRALPDLSASDTMTIELCAAYAKSKGYKYFGVEYGRECWAGNTLSQDSTATTFSSCAMKCKGDSSQTCGGSGLMNLYLYSPMMSSTSSTSTSISFTSSSPTSLATSSSTTSTQIQTSTISGSGPVSTDPVSDGTGVVDLSEADVVNAQIVDENRRVVIVMNPPADGGEASIEVPASPPADIAAGTEIVVRAEIRAEVLRKRAVLTECTLTMYLGGVLIYSNSIWTTDGNYTTVTSMPTAAQGATTLIIVEYCPGDAASVTIGGVDIGLPTAGSSTSLPLSSSLQSTLDEPNPTSSTLTSAPSTVTSTQQAEQTTIYPPSTALPPTAPMTSISNGATPTSTPPSSSSSIALASTSTPPADMTSAPSVATYSAPSYTDSACSQPTYGPANCMVSGAPVATSGLVAVATGVPVPDGPLIWAFRTCARVCGSIDNCNSYALDRGNWPSDTTSNWTCYFYSGFVEDYAVSYDPTYSAVVWFESGCYTCDPLDDLDGEGSTSATSPISSSEIESLTTASPSATITTAPAGINTYIVAPYTASTCTKPSGYYSCTLSGAPVATSGLLGEATGVPVPSGGSMAQAYESCAGICNNLAGCNAWALDRGVGVYPSSQLDSWTCYFYSGSVSSYAVTYMSQYMAVVWFGNGCYDCDPQDLAVAAPASSTTPSSTSIPQTSTLLQTFSSTSPIPTTSMPSITSAAVFTTSAPAYAPVCTNGVGTNCILSGAPVATSGLLAVATAVSATPVNSNEGFEKQYTICARICAEIESCESFALDRGSWPTVLDDWSCYFYSGRVREYAVSYNSQYAAVVWFGNDCYQCLPESSSTTSLQITTSASSTNMPESTAVSLTTTTAPITTQAPTYAVLSAVPYTSGVCSTQSVPGNQEPCAISGWPTPTSASGLLAIATGVAPVASGVYNFAEPFQVCARECASTDGCTLWAVDRGNWPSDMSDWSCLLYDFDGRNYLLTTSPGSAYTRYAWSSYICYNCSLSEPVLSSSTLDPTTGFTSTPSSSTAPLTSTTPLTSSSTPATTLPPSSAVPTVSAAPLVTSCNKPTAAQWYTNSCTISGVPTATSGLVAVATGVVPPVTGNYDFEPYYQQCASICAGISGCTGYALDRGNWPTDLSDWTCYFYGFNIATYLHGQTYSTDYRSVVWMNELCFDCPVPATSSAVPSTTTSTTEPQSTSTVTTPSATSTSAAPVCTRAASPDPSISCDIRGFKEPEEAVQSLYVLEQTDCAAYCSQLRDTDTESCSSYMWNPSTSLCAVWDMDAWTAIGDDAIAGKSYKDNVMDDFGCWDCPSGAQVHAYPV